MSNKKLSTFTNFNKGINTTASYDELDPTELVSAVNIDLKARGGYTQRKGCSKYKVLLEDEQPLQFPVSRLIDYPEEPLLVINKSLRNWNNNTKTLMLNSNKIEYEFFTNEKLYFLDGTEYWMYNGTTVDPVVSDSTTSDLTPIKKCTHLIQRGQRMFALGNPDNPNYLYFSDLGDPTSFQPASVVKAITDDTDVLTGMALFADNLLVFKKKDIFKWTGWDPTSDVEFKRMDTGHGAVCSGTIQMSEDFLIFADEEGVFALTAVDTDLVKSYCISRTIEEIYGGLTNLDKMRSVIYEGNYYLACCNNGTGVNNLVLKASLGMAYNGSIQEGISSLLFPWVTYEGWNVSDWSVIGTDLFFASSVDGTIYKAFDGYSDAGVAIRSEASHYLKLEDAVTRKKLKRLFLVALQDQAHSCNIRLDIEAGYTSLSKMVSIDESGAWDVGEFDEVMWDWVDTVTKEIRIGKKVTRIKIRISHDILDEVMTIYGFAAYYKTKKPRGSRNGIADIEAI